jgi:tRNA1Val (adenine37-N6)-methyltransferase
MTKATRPFHFKQFSVTQEKAAMKVGTDGVLLGAWAGLSVHADEKIHILDVGSGTGLVALMLAQRFPNASILAIEPESGAFEEMNFNFSVSPFAGRITAQNTTLQAFTAYDQFDLIVCNPPYFSNKGAIASHERGLARSNFSLPLDVLAAHAIRLLKTSGKLSVISPVEAVDKLMDKGMYLHALTRVHSLPQKPPVRILAELGLYREENPSLDSLTIETERHVYTQEFKTLLCDFYLAF